MKIILAIDGGGIRGIIPAMLLKHIENKTKIPIADSVDMICGVSTGGLIATMVGIPGKGGEARFPAASIVELYEKYGSSIFKERCKFPFYWMIKSKYSSKFFEKLLYKTIGNHQFSQLKVKTMVPAYDLVERRPYFFKSWKPSVSNIATNEVILATTAAPIYFDPRKVNMSNGAASKILIDGSVAVNNPAMCAYAEAKILWPNEDIYIISLGTGDIADPIKYKKNKHWGFLNWGIDVIEILVDAPTNTVDYQLRTLIPEKYIRIHQKIEMAEEELDNASRKNIRKLISESKNIIAGNEYKLDKVIEIIEKRNRELTSAKKEDKK